GFLSGYHDNCPKCGEEVESYQRITGYIRQVSRFNLGKRAEFYDRRQLKI
ncbi:MAG: anaerobic ribonucleoside-triphosphate reductase, partial [Halanaerobiales bacterium]